MRVSVRVPASSANLGPGFDALAIALDLSLSLEVTADAGCEQVRVMQGPELRGGADLVLQGMRLAARAAERSLPGCAVAVRSEVPVARGLGSSAAALVGGLLAGNLLLDAPLSDAQLFQLASEAEGHGDNVAGSLYGGVALVVSTKDGPLYRRIPIGGPLGVVVFVPDHPGLTRDARAVIPPSVSREDAVANASRCALLALALASGEFSLLGEAMGDRLHQPYRTALFPYVPAMISEARAAGAYGACLSGAGPSVLALTSPDHSATVAEALCHVSRRAGIPGRALDLTVAEQGAQSVVLG